MHYQKPNVFLYRIAQAASWIVAHLLFGRKIQRNEIKGKKGPFVVIANHESALDFVNLICANRRPMHFVISKSVYITLPITGYLNKMGVIPKQQFQTTVNDMKRMRSVIVNGQPLVIYPAGLMCEDGLSTPIPKATFKFLKWLDADIYVARTYGTYFVMPKWAKGFRPGRTYLDIYKLFDRAQLQTMDISQIRSAAEEALMFDAYREQDELQIRYRGNDNLEGLQNVLYQCPHCIQEFGIQVQNKKTLHCVHCGFTTRSDPNGMLLPVGEGHVAVRYVSDWSRLIYRLLKEKIRNDPAFALSADVQIRMIDPKKHKFIPVGEGALHLNWQGVRIEGTVNGQTVDLQVAAASLPSLPFSPGKHLEVQYGEDIYRCVFRDGRLVMKFINCIKILHELSVRSAQAVQ